MIRVLDRAIRSHRFLLFLQGISVAIWLATLIVWLGDAGLLDTVSRFPFPLRVLINISSGLIILAGMTGSIILWVSMIYYWRHYDALTTVSRTLWFIVIFFGFCFGASAYLWLRVTTMPFAEGQAEVVRVRARHSATRILRILTLASLGLCLITAFLGAPVHPALPQDILAAAVLILVPITMFFTLGYIIAAVFEKAD